MILNSEQLFNVIAYAGLPKIEGEACHKNYSKDSLQPVWLYFSFVSTLMLQLNVNQIISKIYESN